MAGTNQDGTNGGVRPSAAPAVDAVPAQLAGDFSQPVAAPTIGANAGNDGLFVRTANLGESLPVEGIRRVADGAGLSDNLIDIRLSRTRFVKRMATDAFDGLQNRETRTFSDFPTPRRREILVIGANNWGNGHALPPPAGGFIGAGSGNRVRLRMRHTTSIRDPFTYDADPGRS